MLVGFLLLPEMDLVPENVEDAYPVAALQAGIDYVISYIPGVAYDHEPMQRYAQDVVEQFS